MKTIALFASISIASGLMFANVYTSLVDAKSWGQRYSGAHRSREGILQDGKSGEFFSDIVSFESSAGTRCAGLVLEIIVSHPHVPGGGSRLRHRAK